MSRNYEALNYAQHGKLFVKQGLSLTNFENQNMIPVVLNEFERISSEFPIVFVRNEKGELTPVALLSLSYENNFLKSDGWQARVVPHALVNAPFALANGKKENEYLIAIDTKDSLVNEQADGVAIFTESGKETPAMQKRKKHLVMYTQQLHLTRQFTQLAAEKKLITSRKLTVEKKGEKVELPEFFVMDSRALDNLSQKSLIDLKKMGILGKCYALAHSLEQLGKLAESI